MRHRTQTWRRGNALDLTGTKENVLTPDQRSQHVYISGASGSGKTKYLEYLIRQDLLPAAKRKHSLVVLDPHGGLYEALMAYCSRRKIGGIVPINLSDPNFLVGFNLLAKRDLATSTIVDSVATTILHAWGSDSFNSTPTLYRVMRSLIWKLYDLGLTLADAPQFLFFDGIRHLQSLIVTHAQDRTLASIAIQELARLRQREFTHEATSTLNRLSVLADHPIITPMLGSPTASLNLVEAIDENKIILVNLAGSKHTGPQQASLFGSLFLSALWLALKERGKPNDPRNVSPVYCYCDELELFLSPVVAQALAEARGYGLHLTLSNQFPHQIALAAPGQLGERILAEVMNNCSTKITFRLTDPKDLNLMAHQFFFNQIDPLKEKYQLHRTAVVNYETRSFEHYTSSRALTLDPETYLETSLNVSEGYSTSESLVPVLGEEVSQIKEYTVDEQRLLHQQSIFNLPNRQAFIKKPPPEEALEFTTPFIHASRPLPRHLSHYLENLKTTLPYYHDGDQLRIECEQRTSHLLRSTTDEPEAFD